MTMNLDDTGFYCVQEIRGEYVGMAGHTDDEACAIRVAKSWLRDPCFEGDSVRVMTIDGELVGIYTAKDI